MEPEREILCNAILRKAQLGDVSSREKVVEMNLPLITNLVKRFNLSWEESEDLFQVGCIGLLKAVDRFDFEKNVRFSTYAVPVILGEIKMYLRKNSMIKASRALTNVSQQIKIKKEEYIKKTGREPSIKELAEELRISIEDIIMAVEVGQEPLSYDTSTIHKYGREENLCSTDFREELILNKITLQEVLAALPYRERQIIFLRFFEEKTQREVAEKLGMSQEQVSRLERKIINGLKETMESGND